MLAHCLAAMQSGRTAYSCAVTAKRVEIADMIGPPAAYPAPGLGPQHSQDSGSSGGDFGGFKIFETLSGPQGRDGGLGPWKASCKMFETADVD